MDANDHADTSEPAAPGSPQWEALCRRCGRCCHEKVRFGGQVVITDIPCEFLDTASNLCTVYPDRFKKQPRCAGADASVSANSLPGDCPYTGGVDGYRNPHFLSEHPEYEKAINALYPGRNERMNPSKRNKRPRCAKST